MLGHELRNPLGAARSALEVLAHAGASEAQRAEGRRILDRQIHHLTRIVDDLLEVSRITGGRIRLRPEAVRLERLVEGAIEVVRRLVEERGHELSVSLPEDAMEVEVDPTRLQQVLVNLLINAAKYTDPGGHIAVEAGIQDATLEIRVIDDGRGLSPEMLERAFELFAKEDLQEEGVGLGLTLARRLVELHGGTLRARSEGPGLGSEFVVRLPVSAAQSPAARSA